MKHKLAKLSNEELQEIICEMLEESSVLGTEEHHKFKEFVDDKLYRFTKDEAEHIVRNMKPYGQVFSMTQCKDMITDHLEEYSYIKYYLCMNMYANDARNVADHIGMPLDKFCYHMAQSFINDIDAGPHKVEKYFTEVTAM